MTGLDKRTTSPDGTAALGAALAPALAAGDVIALRGPLGAGKTRFVAGLVRAGSPGRRVRSPSFTLMHEYPGPPTVFHLDLYRLSSADVDGLGLDEAAERGALVVEWGERLPAAWLHEALMLTFEPVDGDARAIHASAFGGRGAMLLERWRQLPASW